MSYTGDFKVIKITHDRDLLYYQVNKNITMQYGYIFVLVKVTTFLFIIIYFKVTVTGKNLLMHLLPWNSPGCESDWTNNEHSIILFITL